MGVIVNPRGTSGAGKTEFVRRLLADYGWGRGGSFVPIRLAGRRRPLGYAAGHPFGGRPLVVLGHYEATCGGCDTIGATDGGMERAFELAAEHAAAGSDVLLEGLLLSAEHRRSAELAAAHRLHVLRLATPADACVRNLIARRRAGRSAAPFLARKVASEADAVERACRLLRPVAQVENLAFDDALARARGLLGLDPLAAVA